MSSQPASTPGNNDAVTPMEIHSRHSSVLETRALRLKGVERYEYLLDRKTKELSDKLEQRSDIEAKMFAHPNTRLNRERRRELEAQLKELEDSIAEVQADISLLQRRVREYQEHSALPSGTPVHATTVSDTPFAPSAVMSTPVPHRSQQDPFLGQPGAAMPPPLLTTEEQPSSCPNPFKVPRDLPRFRTGGNAITEVEVFTRQFEVQLRAHGINIDISWYRLLPLCFTEEILEWLDRSHKPSESWQLVRASLHHHYGNPSRDVKL